MKPTQSIPKQLCSPNLKFYRANQKIPFDKAWNTTNNHHFFDETLRQWPDNYGIVCGTNNLIVLDFDSQAFYESVAGLLPPTFTVLTATKRLPHLYYFLDGLMFNKTAIRSNDGTTLMDVQANKSGIIGPNSIINRRYYTVVNDIPIATISLDQLHTTFPDLPLCTPHPVDPDTFKPDSPIEVKQAHKLLQTVLGLKLIKNDLYCCPLHPSVGNANLHVTPWASVYCFHEQRSWKNALAFAKQYAFLKRPELLPTLRIIEQETVTK